MKYLIFIIALFVSSTFALDIQNLRVNPNNIDAGSMTRIMFKISKAAFISIDIQDLNGNIVTSLVKNVLYHSGQFSIPWKTSKNIDQGYYTPVINAVDQKNGSSISKMIDTKIARMISIPFDISDQPGIGKRISYSLDSTALVSIRVGINNGPLYKILSNWELTKPGNYSIDWDGWDNDHVLQVDQLANYLIDVRTIPVEIKALHITNKNKNKKVATSVPATEILRQIDAFIPKFSVDVSNKKKASEKTDSLMLNITVDQKTLDELGDIPFEYVLYIDGKRYAEIENSLSPFSWEIFTQNLSKGNHIFTLMLCTSIEQINSKSFKVNL